MVTSGGGGQVPLEVNAWEYQEAKGTVAIAGAPMKMSVVQKIRASNRFSIFTVILPISTKPGFPF